MTKYQGYTIHPEYAPDGWGYTIRKDGDYFDECDPWALCADEESAISAAKELIDSWLAA